MCLLVTIDYLSQSRERTTGLLDRAELAEVALQADNQRLRNVEVSVAILSLPFECGLCLRGR